MPKEKSDNSQAKTTNQPSKTTKSEPKRKSADEEQSGRKSDRSSDQNKSTQARGKKKGPAEESPVMTRQEAGRLGGKATARNHGSDYYKNLGRRGAEARWGGSDEGEEEDTQQKKESA